VKVLGISVSARRFGNTELLVKEALFGAKEQGAEIDFIRLTDFKIDPCEGCINCVVKHSECIFSDRDDAMKIYRMISEHDALVLGSPTYILGIPGILKLLLDRGMAYMYGIGRPNSGKPAVAIGVAGVKNWEAFTLPQMAVFLLSLGFNIVDQFIAYGQGPGEVLFDKDIVERAHRAGELLVKGGRADYDSVCPSCGQNIFRFVDEETIECAVCGSKGRITTLDGKPGIEWFYIERRWSDKEVVEHFEGKILPSVPRFLKNRHKIKELRKKYLK